MSIWQAPGGDATHTRMPNSAEHPDFSWWSQPTSVRVGLDLRARFAVIRRRMFVFVGALLMALSIGAFVSIKSTRMYRATATIYIDVNVPEVLSGVRDVYDMGVGYWASREYYETQYSIIRSHQVCDKAAALLGLFPQAMLQELARVPPPSVEAQVAGEPLFDLPRPLQEKLRMLGLGHVHRRDSLVQALQNMDPALFIQSRISVAPVRNSRLVQIMGEDSDPDQAMAYANAAADAYIALNLDQKLDVTQAAVGWLHNQVVDLKAKVESSELALHDFRKRNNMVSLSIEDHQNIISQTLAQLNQSLSAARAQGFGLHSQGKQIAATLARGHMPDFLSEEATSSFIQKLRSTYFDLQQQEAELRVAYTAEHPKVQVLSDRTHRAGAALRDELQRVAMKIAKQYEQSLDTQAQLEREINLTKALALELNKKEIDYSRLKRERDTNLALYEVVVKREKEATLTQMLKVNNVRRLDMARRPLHPIRPDVPMTMVASLLIGLLGSISLVFLVDQLDTAVKSQDQIEQLIRVPFFGIVPQITTAQAAATGTDLFVSANPRSVAAECWRAVRTNVMFASPGKPFKRLLISSHGPREGKSTTAINLAFTMAALGARTLIVDTDMRRPRIHKAFGLSNDAGISTLVVEDVDIDSVIHRGPIDRLDILTCGPVPPNPCELLHTDRFSQILEQLGERYERIIFDSPPVGAVTDALVLAAKTDGVLMVLRAGKSSWQASVRTRRRFEDVGARVYGAILNGVDLDKYSGREYYYYMNTGKESA